LLSREYRTSITMGTPISPRKRITTGAIIRYGSIRREIRERWRFRDRGSPLPKTAVYFTASRENDVIPSP